MNSKKIRAAILACVLISGIAFSAIHYSEPLKTLLGDNGSSDQYNTIQYETEDENDGSKMTGSKSDDAGSNFENSKVLQDEHQDELQDELQDEHQDELQDDQQDTYIQEDRLLLAEQTEQDQYTTSRGKVSRAFNEQFSEADTTPDPNDQSKEAVVIKDEPDTSETMNSEIDTTKEAYSDAGVEASVSQDEGQGKTNAAGELDLLARLITAEAQGEPYEAQVAVGAVVMNRVKSSSWPDSIEGVIYQVIDGYYQFTPVVNGWIDKPAQEQSLKAAREVLGGADPTNGAQFYYDDTTTNPWILSKTVSVQIGHMIFAF